MRRILASIVMVALCLANAATGHAGQVSQPMNVSLTIGTSGGQATILVGSLLLAGPAPGPATGTTVVHVTATANLPYVITLNQGLHWTSGSSRTLQVSGPCAGGSCLLTYSLYTSSNLAQLWGNGDPVLGPGVSGIGTGSDQAFTVYGLTASYQIGGTSLPDGTYTDVVTAAVDF
jgi:spore coat protein U-like protein